MNIEYPSITATGTQALEQIKSYLFRLSEQLNYELNNLDRSVVTVETKQKEVAASIPEEKTPLAQFDALKSLIINSAEIVSAYTEEINKTLSGEYVANDEVYGTFKQTTENYISASSTAIQQNYSNIQQIISDLNPSGEDETRTLIVNAHIKTGLLDGEATPPVYGVEVGQTDNSGSFQPYARFTATELAFYSGKSKVAYFSNSKLYITEAEITSSLKVGGYILSKSSGLSFNWVG